MSLLLNSGFCTRLLARQNPLQQIPTKFHFFPLAFLFVIVKQPSLSATNFAAIG